DCTHFFHFSILLRKHSSLKTVRSIVHSELVLIKKELDQRLIDRTVEIAKQKGGFGSSQLKAADNSSPLWGAGKVEDTYNLLGHALRKAVSAIARAVQGRELAEIASEVGAPILNSSSLKTAYNLNWDNPVERQNALSIILNNLASVVEWMQSQSNCDEFEAAQDTGASRFCK
ncbi:hypothetical protein QUA78_32630, partial [Microcoleus sp. K4-B3]